MGKCVSPHHGFVGLHDKTGGLADHATSGQNLLCINANIQIEIIAASFNSHDDFFKRAIAGALAQAVDRAFNLPCTADFHACQRVRNGHAEIVMAMHGPHNFVRIGNAFTQVFDEITIQLRNGIADGVGHIDGRSALDNHRLNHATKKVWV